MGKLKNYLCLAHTPKDSNVISALEVLICNQGSALLILAQVHSIKMIPKGALTMDLLLPTLGTILHSSPNLQGNIVE